MLELLCLRGDGEVIFLIPEFLRGVGKILSPQVPCVGT